MSTNDLKGSGSMFRLNGKNYLFAFIMITSLFALWGFANDITNPMVAAFKNILLITNFESSLVQFAFYGGYCFMAIPAALFIRKFNYKKGILVGLGLYSIGCFLFIPAGIAMAFWAFLIAYFVMTCGLAFLETTSNPYILALGPEDSATRRLNFAQAFNPIGSLTGMLIAKEFILKNLDKATEGERLKMLDADPARLELIQQSDLDIVSLPYLLLGGVVLCFFIVFFAVRLPKILAADSGVYTVGQTVKNLLKNKRYVWSVVAQAFYVGVQIMVWTFIIQYAEKELDMPKATAQGYNMLAMGIFVTSRFICTFLLKYLKSSVLLATLAIAGGLFTLGAIFLPNAPFVEGQYAGAYWGLYCIVAISACMSLMFPTIYGIALKGMGDEAKLASAGLILAIGGGCVMPPLQGLLIDKANWFEGLASVRISFVLPLICFIVIACFGYWVYRNSNKAM
ncbi:MAG: L-fucose:H+ symporter permease [Prevotellaceae bacterium]|jgi:FHS family L-fucose permease-like MFS transporter|nr:L-fucose:H+ symporter permease [Prevotellaceae bacterium]